MSSTPTANVCKQMMQKLLLRKFRPHTSCSVQMKPVRIGQTAKTRDDLVYTLQDGVYRLFQVVDMDEDSFTVHEFNITPKSFRRHQNLDFGVTGVFNNNGYKTGVFVVEKEEIGGKVVMVGNSLLMTVPINILTEI